MNTLLSILVLLGCVAAMAVGLLFAQKVLKRGCSVDPDSCACRAEGKDPKSCDKS